MVTVMVELNFLGMNLIGNAIGIGNIFSAPKQLDNADPATEFSSDSEDGATSNNDTGSCNLDDAIGSSNVNDVTGNSNLHDNANGSSNISDDVTGSNISDRATGSNNVNDITGSNKVQETANSNRDELQDSNR